MTNEATTTAVKSTSRRTEPTTTTHRQTLGRAIRSEWIKLRTLRSTWIGLGTALAGSVLIGALTASFLSGLAQNPAVPAAVSEQASVQLAEATAPPPEPEPPSAPAPEWAARRWWQRLLWG